MAITGTALEQLQTTPMAVIGCKPLVQKDYMDLVG
jgi:hypothetical protein